jgi:hypothetical protein
MTDNDARNWISCLGWGCLAVVVISVLGIGGCVAFFYKGGSDAHAAANVYLAAVQAGDFEAAFATLGPEFTGARGLSDFVAFEQAARAELGSCGEWKMSGTSFNRESGRSMAQLTYRRTCESGPLVVAFNLEQIDGEWLIQDIRYNEALEARVERCAGCSAVVPTGAKFCAHCGAAIGDDPEEPEQEGSAVPAISQGVPEPTAQSSGPPE